ncbi:MAG: TldD/PmbA family protein [Thermoanaerobaculia bacterium]|nr:TldD/PmbA family protein [Thermoanaerobaculia bacterium]
MSQMTQDEARAVLEKVLSFKKCDGLEANLNGDRTGNLRYARNSVTTAGVVEDLSLVVQANYGKKVGTTTINELDDASLEKAVRAAESIAQLAPEDPEFMGVLGPQKYSSATTFFDSTAGIDGAYRASAAAASLEPCRKKKLVAAGYLEDRAGFSAMMNSAGLFAYQASTRAEFSVTVRTEDGTGSGYATRDYNDVAKLDTSAASQIAIDKALGSREAKAIEPGKYTVILEPAAVSGLVGPMIRNMNARSTDEGRSFLSKQGGGSRRGEKLLDERVTIFSDPAHPEVPYSPWSGDGQPRPKTTWIKNGVVENLYCSRFWASTHDEWESIPFPGSLVMKGGDESLAQLIAGTKKGILVTRLWYIRTVDPQTLLYTGLTRDGTFFIENGKIAFPVKNFRFNESPVIMLNNLEAMGKSERIEGDYLPPLKVRDFTFTSLSDAV